MGAISPLPLSVQNGVNGVGVFRRLMVKNGKFRSRVPPVAPKLSGK